MSFPYMGIGSEALRQMRGLGGSWHSYRNADLSSERCGDRRFLAVGEGRTFRTPPARYPDSHLGTGWAYLHEGEVDLATGEIRR